MSEQKKPKRRDFLFTASYAIGAVGVGAAVWPLIDQMNPDSSVKALASTEVDVSSMKVYKGDILLLCSDGLSGLVSDKSIEEIISINDFQKIPEKLIEIANQNGGTDNITVLVGMVTSGINYNTKNGFLSKLFKI